VFVLLNKGYNVFIELVSPTILDNKLPRDASLRDAENISFSKRTARENLIMA
jgi:hypothetical protein